MNDIAKRVTNLSPVKRTLLELKLRKKVATISSDGKAVAHDMARRVADLSPAKRMLLELKLKLKQKAAPISPVGQAVARDMVRRVAELSPAKRMLLELRLRNKAAPISSSGQPAITELAKQIANLSPAKRTLLELRLKKKSGDISGAIMSLPPAIIPEAEIPEEVIPAGIPSTYATPDIPDLGEPEMSDWITELFPQEKATSPEPPDEVGDEEEPPILDWMSGLKEVTEDEATALSSGTDIVDVDDEAEIPAWLSEEEDTLILSDEVQADHHAEALPAPVASTSAGRIASSWLDSLGPETETIIDDEDQKTAEVTGMLSGISTLLPAEKISIPTPEIDGLQDAAQEFYKIATEVPQVATLPTPLTRRERVIGSAVRSVLYLIFIALIMLPLLPGTRQVVDNITVPWSEPTGPGRSVLDSQRRQLISEQLGIIDLQQPGSIALVSFDYSPATQGEMQPLAEAVMGRLKGQGMRLISVSLEPEGAAIAQYTLETILAERDDSYGVEVVNLGYLPGQMAAIRELVTGQESLSAIPDFKENLPLQARSEWNDVQNLDQVDIVVSFADTPTTTRWWIEQLEAAPPSNGRERLLLAATSATAEPFLRPYRDSEQLDGLISGINGAAAIEAGRNRFGQARQMIDSLGIATITIVILIAIGTIVGWMPSQLSSSPVTESKDGTDHPLSEESESTRQV